MELDYKAIGKRIKIARIKKNLTQEAIADKIGITPQHVSNIETGNASVSLTRNARLYNNDKNPIHLPRQLGRKTVEELDLLGGAGN